MRFEGQHRGCCDGCAWAARAVATLYGLRASIAPIAHWPLPLASVMETSFLNVPRGRRARAGQFLSGGRSDRRRAACWRPLRHNSNLKWAAPRACFMPKRPNLGHGLAISGPAYVWEPPRKLLGVYRGTATVLQSCCRGSAAQKDKLSACTDYEHPKAKPLHRDTDNHCPNGFCNNAQATQAYAPRWEA